MENILAIGAGIVLRLVLDFATENDHKLIGILIGLWEGVVLSHFLSKRTRSSKSKDPYLALATRLAIDLYLTHSLSRFALTCAWTLLGLLLSDVAPSIWRDTGLRSVYKALKRELRAIRKVLPRWKIENDLKVPKISVRNSVSKWLSRRPPSSVVSSTRAAPPASPVPASIQRISRRAALSETNTELSRVREIVPGPSPALIPTAADPDYRPPPSNLQSQRPSPLSEDLMVIPDDIWVQVDAPPLTFEVGIQTANSVIASPSPRTYINPLPRIPTSETDHRVLAHQVPLPESRPASVVGSVLSLFGAKNILSRARGDKAKSDVGVDSTQHLARLTDRQRPAPGSAAGQGYMGHYHAGSGAGPSMLRHVNDDDGSVVGGSVVGRGARTEPVFGGRSESPLDTAGTGFVGGLTVELGGIPEDFVGGFETEFTGKAESFVGGFAAECGHLPQPLSVLGETTLPSQDPPANLSPSIKSVLDPAPAVTAVDVNSQTYMDGNPAVNTNITTEESPVYNVDDAQNPASTASQKQEKPGKPEGGRKKKGAKNTTPVPSNSATPAPPETTSQGQPNTFSDLQQPGPDENPAGLTDPTRDVTTHVQNTNARPTVNTQMEPDAVKDGGTSPAPGPDFPDGNLDTPPPPFKEVATPVEPTLLTQEQADRESLRGEFLMRELKHLEMLVAKAETGIGRGSPSALSVERLNGTRERLVRVRMRVERRVYEDAPAELPSPPQLTLSGIDGPSAVDLVHSAIVDALLETPHAETLSVVGYINKQKRTSPKAVETKTAVVDWVKENKFKVRTEQMTPFILNITF